MSNATLKKIAQSDCNEGIELGADELSDLEWHFGARIADRADRRVDAEICAAMSPVL